MKSDVETLCEAAMDAGRGIDLAGCAYGPRFLTAGFLETPPDYYRLLAGLVRTLDLRRVVELGTHWGGAIMAMWHGLRDPASAANRLVTVDVALKNVDGFRRYPHIRRITGDGLDDRVLDEIARFVEPPVDVVFVDAEHDYRRTRHAIAVYASRLAPRFMILDDIHLNHSMDRLWRDVRGVFGERAFDASRLCDRERCGFGIVQWDPRVRWPERYGHLVGYWRLRRRLEGWARRIP